MTCTSSAAGRPQLHVGRKTSVGLERERVQDEVGHLFGWRQGSRLGSTKDGITDGVVPQDPITASPTANLMVSKHTSNTVALWAGVGRAVKGNSQPMAEAAAELLVLQVETQPN